MLKKTFCSAIAMPNIFNLPYESNALSMFLGKLWVLSKVRRRGRTACYLHLRAYDITVIGRGARRNCEEVHAHPLVLQEDIPIRSIPFLSGSQTISVGNYKSTTMTALLRIQSQSTSTLLVPLNPAINHLLHFEPFQSRCLINLDHPAPRFHGFCTTSQGTDVNKSNPNQF